MNQVTLIGNLGQDPVLRHTPSGNPVLNFNLAVDRRSYKVDNNGQKILHRDVDWIPCVLWNQKAEKMYSYLQKGSQIAVSGNLRQRSYESNGKKVNVIEVKVQEIQFLSKIKAAEKESQ
jgi:single-strand DNA-binding protein